MAWTVEFNAASQAQLDRLDPQNSRRIVTYMREGVSALGNPRLRGKALRGDYAGLWRYRVGHYRVICEIRDDVLTVLVVEVVHRSEAYR